MIGTGIKSLIASRWLRRSVTIFFVALIVALLTREVRTVRWDEVMQSLHAYRASTLIIAGALSALSYLIYSCFDLIGRRYVNADVTAPAAMTTAFVSYAFNQSLGALIGAIAFRVRLYSRLGLSALQISKLIVLSVVTNWLGYATVAGLVFMFGVIALPAGWDIGERILHLVGAVMLLSSIGYVALCGLSSGRRFIVKNQPVEVPSLRMASVQLALSIVHWPVEAAIIYVLLHDRVDFVTTLGGLLLNAIAGVLLHIPAGLGVLETIFVGLLHGRVPMSSVLAALLVFRAFYYLVPLAVATLIYMRTEARPSPLLVEKQDVTKSNSATGPRRLSRLHPTEK